MDESTPVEILCASANPLLLDGLRHLDALSNCRVIAEARDVASMLASLRNSKPAILILDLDLTAREPGVIQECRLAHSGLKVVLVEGNEVDPTLSLEIQAADAFVDRKQSMATLVKRLEGLTEI